MTTANEPTGGAPGVPPTGWPVLPPPDLSETYAQLPQTWKTSAVLLANRLLAAAYRADVMAVVEQVVRDVEAGAIRGMTIGDYLDEQTEGHPRVVDYPRALQCLAYSPANAAAPLLPGEVSNVTRLATTCFRADVEAELEARGVLGEEGPDIDLPENPF